MSTERDEAGLREQFRRLRRQDESLGRPFSAFSLEVRRRAPVASSRHVRHRLAAAAFGLALAAGVIQWLRPGPARLPEEAAIARLTRWRAPTDSLLRSPGDQLLHGVPRLGESAVGGDVLADHPSRLLRRQ
jgi:hypothetical protein